MELETQRLRLDALQARDAEALLRYRADPEVSRYQGWRPGSLADAQQFIRDQSAMFEPVVGRWFQRAIRRRDDALLIGDIGFCLSEDGQAEFGITLAPAQQGNGYAREALRAVLDMLFGAQNIHRVHASVDPRNLPCVALLGALGLRQEAHFRESLRFRGEWVDDLVFAMLARDWREIPHEDAATAASR